MRGCKENVVGNFEIRIYFCCSPSATGNIFELVEILSILAKKMTLWYRPSEFLQVKLFLRVKFLQVKFGNINSYL